MAQSSPHAFRTAVGGFHKGDVSAYITKTAAAHQAEVAALQDQLINLQAENDRLREQLIQQPEAEPAPAAEQAPEELSLRDQELAAYRRAEAAERLASQRAKKLYDDMQRICDRSARQLDETDAGTQAAMDAIGAQLLAIRSAAEALYTGIRTSSEELRAMSQMVPDPAEGLEEL